MYIYILHYSKVNDKNNHIFLVVFRISLKYMKYIPVLKMFYILLYNFLFSFYTNLFHYVNNITHVFLKC
jgi:hypothetical protein